MSKPWSDSASAYLARRDLCPRCDYPITLTDRCTNCEADLASPIAQQVVAASAVVVDALAARQNLVDALPTLPPLTPPMPVPPTPSVAGLGVSAPRQGSQISVQSVLAIVGAALLAVAAIVFTFFNPDLTDFGTRTTIVAVTTVVFLGGAWLLVRAKLQFSAEAIGALGMVFVVLDVWAFSHNAPHGVSPFIFAGIGTAFGAVVMIGIAIIARIRTWLWLGLLGFTIAPAWFGYASGSLWSSVVGHIAVGLVALGVLEFTRRLHQRFDSELRADRWMATVVALLVLVVVSAQLLTVLNAQSGARSAAALAALALLAIANTRNELPRFWSFAAGALVTCGAIELVGDQVDSGWFVALAPASAAAAVVLLSALTRLRPSHTGHRVSRTAVLIGGMSVLLASSLLALATAAEQYLLPFETLFVATGYVAAAVGLGATASGLAAIWRVSSREVTPRFRRANLPLAVSFGMAAVISFTSLATLAHDYQVASELVVAAALSLLLALVPRARSMQLGNRLPALIGVHLLVIHAAAVAWSDPLLSQVGGTAVVLAFVAVTLASPPFVRPVHTAIGFAYALTVFAHVLQLAHLETIALFSLTTALASTAALVVTLVRPVTARFWYAVLIVTAVPFIIGIVEVLFVRSGWTALSTGVTFALALTLVLTKRTGLSRLLRATASALLVPALAVVVIALGAQLLRVSASPITLPIIAVLVACVLPSTGLIGTALARRGIPGPHAATARLWIEISTLVTGALAVILALVRAAAGLDTSLIVLLIIGIGAAAAALINHRRYGWIVAAASWTGALWCFWGTLGVQVLEPYLLPPAIAATVIGAIAVLRNLPGLGLYSVGLACAVLPSIVLLTGWGDGAVTPWRAYGLLSAVVLLLVLGGIARRRPDFAFGSLGTPTLVVAIVAAAAGAIQAARVASRLDTIWLTAHQPVMIAVLELSLAATVLAALGGRFLVTRARLARGRWRWVYVPATAYLVIAPIAAVRPGWLSVWAMFALTIVLLAAMIATALRSRTCAVALPPVWFLFSAAWCTAVAGWSVRSLRVEAFSVPLGLALLVVGIIAMRARQSPHRNFNSWPLGYAGSWRLLTPGIVVTFVPSILATGTDPQTLRAILVIALALLAILIGSLRRLGAPFLVGIVVLPLENITVFAAQIGRTISATSWWITLASAGAVLLVIAVTYERRSGGERGVAARLRDLR